MMPDEVRKLDKKKCLVFIRGVDPILDNKYVTSKHPMFSQTGDGDEKPYIHEINQSSVTEPAFTLLNEKSLKHFEKLKANGENVYIDEISFADFMKLGDDDMNKRFMNLDEAEQKRRFQEAEAEELAYSEEDSEQESATENVDVSVTNKEETILQRTLKYRFTMEQKEELRRALAVKVPKEVILSYFYPETSVARMMEIRRQYE